MLAVRQAMRENVAHKHQTRSNDHPVERLALFVVIQLGAHRNPDDPREGKCQEREHGAMPPVNMGVLSASGRPVFERTVPLGAENMVVF
jgi:hypothetical protein